MTCQLYWHNKLCSIIRLSFSKFCNFRLFVWCPYFYVLWPGQLELTLMDSRTKYCHLACPGCAVPKAVCHLVRKWKLSGAVWSSRALWHQWQLLDARQTERQWSPRLSLPAGARDQQYKPPVTATFPSTVSEVQAERGQPENETTSSNPDLKENVKLTYIWVLGSSPLEENF